MNGRTDALDSRSLQEHIDGTYLAVRVGLALVGLALPWVLWLAGRGWFDLALQGSMSAYYHTAMRNAFVGGLVSIGVCLVLYKGFSRTEDWVLNVAGILAALVAFLPTNPSCPTGTGCEILPTAVWHKAAAVAFFLCIAFVCIRCASDTLSLIRDADRAEALERLYDVLGGAMIVFPLTTVLVGRWANDGGASIPVTFWLEAVAITVFGAYWIAKSLEIQATRADTLALEGRLEREEAPAPGTRKAPGRVVLTAPSDEEIAEAAASMGGGA